MEMIIEIPQYDPKVGITYKWEPNSNIEIKYEDGATFLKANKAGLISLANHLLNLAQDEVPKGCYLHLDEFNSSAKDSLQMIIEKK